MIFHGEACLLVQVFRTIFKRLRGLPEESKADVMFCAFSITPSETLVDLLAADQAADGIDVDLRPVREEGEVVIRGLSSMQIESLSEARVISEQIFRRRGTSISHFITFIKVFVEDTSSFICVADLANCDKQDILRHSASIDVKHTQNMKRFAFIYHLHSTSLGYSYLLVSRSFSSFSDALNGGNLSSSVLTTAMQDVLETDALKHLLVIMPSKAECPDEYKQCVEYAASCKYALSTSISFIY
jgi:hypothetical protein